MTQLIDLTPFPDLLRRALGRRAAEPGPRVSDGDLRLRGVRKTEAHGGAGYVPQHERDALQEQRHQGKSMCAIIFFSLILCFYKRKIIVKTANRHSTWLCSFFFWYQIIFASCH